MLLRAKYHKLYNHHSANFKFYCAPSEQISPVHIDSSALFQVRKTLPVLWYKYSFLKDIPKSTSENRLSVDEEEVTDDSSDSNSESTDYDSHDTVIYNESSYVRCSKGSKTGQEADKTFLSNIMSMHHKVVVKHSGAVKSILTNDISEIIGDKDISQELDKIKTEPGLQSLSIKSDHFSMKYGPIHVSKDVCLKDLRSAYLCLENRNMDKLYRINVQYESLLKMRDDYLQLTRQSLRIQKELNACETLQKLPAIKSLPHTLQMKVDAVEQSMISKADDVDKIIAQQNNSDDDLSIDDDIKPPSVSEPKPSCSKDTSQAQFEPVVDKNKVSMKDESDVQVMDTGGIDSNQDDLKQEDSEMKNKSDMSDLSDMETSIENAPVLLPHNLLKRFQCALCRKQYVDKRSFDSHC